MRIALAQINSELGNFNKNAEKIIEYTIRAKERRCDMVVFPEATLFGYHPMDLLERHSIVEAQIRALRQLQKKLPKDIGVLIGAFTLNKNKNGKPFYNSALFLDGKSPVQYFNKELLPTYDVFDEARHIEPGQVEKNILKFKGKKILITVCEDIWAFPKNIKAKSLYVENPILRVKKGSVDFCLNISASPYFLDKLEQRRKVTSAVVKHLKCPIVYVNMVGAQDELIFDGGSFALDKGGKVIAQSMRFEEDLNVVDLASGVGGIRQLSKDKLENMRQAIVLGIRDFTQKTGIRKVHLGLSGGIDSALVACLAVDAVGANNVTCVAMPGPYSSALSLKLAKELAKNLGVKLRICSMTGMYKNALIHARKIIGPNSFGLVNENLQARLRAVLLMALGNKEGSILLNTSNKSEMASGYGTLYGDMCGGLSPIGDLLKRDVYALAELYNRELELIPNKIIHRPPSAELRPSQKDTDSLPPYSKLDQAVVNLIEKGQAARSPEEKFLLQMLMKSEFKRWQSPPILKVREHSFGQGRRMPLAHKAFF